jgi:uncharacterized protein (DUF1778 family)
MIPLLVIEAGTWKRFSQGLHARGPPRSPPLALAIEAEWRKHVAGVVPAQPKAQPEGKRLGHSSPFPRRLTPARIDNVDTMANIRLMTKARSTSPDRLGAATPAGAKRSSAAGAKGSVNLRIETHTRQLIDDAAAVLGKTRTEFMIESARKLAIDVLLDQRLFVLDPERYAAFVHALDNPPAPGPKLKSLLRRTLAWES